MVTDPQVARRSEPERSRRVQTGPSDSVQSRSLPDSPDEQLDADQMHYSPVFDVEDEEEYEPHSDGTFLIH